MNEIVISAGSMILDDVDRLSRLITNAQYDAEPHWRGRYGEKGYARAVQDTKCHLLVLSQSLAIETPELLVEYIRWAAVALHSRGIVGAHLDSCLFGYAAQVLRSELSSELSDVALQYVEIGIRQLFGSTIEKPASLLYEAGELAPLAKLYLSKLLMLDRDKSFAMILNARDQGISVEDLCLLLLSTCQREVGRLWQVNEITVAQEHFCTASTQQLLTELYPSLPKSTKRKGVIVVACVGGELHDLGARMVADFLRSSGWVTYYLGQNTPAGGIVDMIEMTGATVLALSCTISVHINLVVETIAAVRRDARMARVRIIVGGRAFECAPALPEKLGANGYARDAGSACLLAASFK